MATLPNRTWKRPTLTMTEEDEFPILFTIDGSNRHEIIFISPTISYTSLTQTLQTHLSTPSPNTAEPLQKYKKASSIKPSIASIHARWGFADGRDKQVFVKSTVITEGNCKAVLGMLALGVGRDVIDVVLNVPVQKESKEKGKDGEAKGEKADAKGEKKADEKKVEDKVGEDEEGDTMDVIH